VSNAPAEIAWLEYQIALAEKKIEQWKEGIRLLQHEGCRRGAQDRIAYLRKNVEALRSKP
jgi:hypothetical protein